MKTATDNLRSRIRALEAANATLHQECVAKTDRIVELEKRLGAGITVERMNVALVSLYQKRIAELEEESAHWQESCGQNYVRATEAEMREERLNEVLTALADAEREYREASEVAPLREQEQWVENLKRASDAARKLLK